MDTQWVPVLKSQLVQASGTLGHDNQLFDVATKEWLTRLQLM